MSNMLKGLRKGHFACIATDCGTKFKTRSKKGITGRSPEKKYRTMTDAQLAALPVGEYAARDCHLFYWETGPRMAKGLHVPIMRAWGFEPSAIWGVWLKPIASRWRQGEFFLIEDFDKFFKMGSGYTSRQNCEFVVLGRRGNPPRLSKNVRQPIIEPAREHSRKPIKFYENVEQYCAGPRLELFGRTQRPNWIVRGNESGKFGFSAAV